MIYLDYNATHPVRPQVRAKIQPFLDEAFGNPSSLHAAGRQVRGTLEEVRADLLKFLGDPKGQMVFTSGGTEANNLALMGLLNAGHGQPQPHGVVSSVEHSSVLQTAQVLVEQGWEITFIPVDSQGKIDLDALARVITPETALVSVQHANNEVGTLQPIEKVAQLAHQQGALFHTDAVQTFGKLPLDVLSVGADLVSISGHKLGGLKGAGALYMRAGVSLHPMLWGGPHEHKLRAGTENVVGILALGEAAQISFEELKSRELQRVTQLRDQLEAGLQEKVSNIQINGHLQERLPGTLSVSFLGCKGETLLMALDLAGICVSTGSACSSGSSAPSAVLKAMGLSPEEIEGSIRFSLGSGTTESEMDEALNLIPDLVERVRSSKNESVE